MISIKNYELRGRTMREVIEEWISNSTVVPDGKGGLLWSTTLTPLEPAPTPDPDLYDKIWTKCMNKSVHIIQHDDTDVMMIEMYPQKPSMVPKEDIIQRTPPKSIY